MEEAVELVKRHVASYPEAGPEDIYKLLYHACMGPEHAVTNPDMVKRWLVNEWSRVRATDGDIYEDITLHSPIFRIHLRQAMFAGIEPAKVLDEFLEAADSFPKKPELLRDSWHAFVMEVENDGLKIAGIERLADFNMLLIEKDFPVTHHSENYRKAYEPAYRLVQRRI